MAYWLIKPDQVIRHYRPAKELPIEAVADLCREVSREIEKSILRKIVARTYTDEIHDGTGGVFLRLTNPPVTSLTVVKLDGVTQPITDFSIADGPTGLIYCAAGFASRPSWRREQSSGIGSDEDGSDPRLFASDGDSDTAGIWKITYAGGFAIESDDIADLVLIARKMVIFQIRESSMLGTASQTAGGYTEARWVMGDQGFAQEVKRVLGRYRFRSIGARR